VGLWANHYRVPHTHRARWNTARRKVVLVMPAVPGAPPRLSELITQHMVTPPIPGGHLRLAGGAVASVC